MCLLTLNHMTSLQPWLWTHSSHFETHVPSWYANQKAAVCMLSWNTWWKDATWNTRFILEATAYNELSWFYGLHHVNCLVTVGMKDNIILPSIHQHVRVKLVLSLDCTVSECLMLNIADWIPDLCFTPNHYMNFSLELEKNSQEHLKWP